MTTDIQTIQRLEDEKETLRALADAQTEALRWIVESPEAPFSRDPALFRLRVIEAIQQKARDALARVEGE